MTEPCGTNWSRRRILSVAFGSLSLGALAGCQVSPNNAGKALSAGTPAHSAGVDSSVHWVQKIIRRPANERGSANLGWLDTRYSFSFSKYQDPAHMGFRALRVINEDWISAGGGFPMHPHRDMEIITYVLEGALQHRDSTGQGGIIRPGIVQWMSAGTGIRHSEFNPSSSDPTHLIQIWIHPDQRGHVPAYDERAFPMEDQKGRLRLVASPDGRDGSIQIHADTRLFTATLAAGSAVTVQNAPERHLWIQIARGKLSLNNQAFGVGDGAAISEPGSVEIRGSEESEILVFDLA
jgi:redox-sensitive bicupin YhaK (pirin superfamily)